MNLLRNIYKKNFEVPKNVISQIKINFFFFTKCRKWHQEINLANLSKKLYISERGTLKKYIYIVWATHA